jgi:hypothetical protein
VSQGSPGLPGSTSSVHSNRPSVLHHQNWFWRLHFYRRSMLTETFRVTVYDAQGRLELQRRLWPLYSQIVWFWQMTKKQFNYWLTLDKC